MFSDMAAATEPIREWFENDFPGFAKTAESAFSSALSGVAGMVSDVLSDLWTILMSFTSTFSSAVFPVFASLGAELTKTFSTVFSVLQGLFGRVWKEGILPFLQNLSKYWNDVWQSLKAVWDAHGQPIFDGIRTAVQAVGEFLKTTWETLIRPIWDQFMANVDWLWTNHLKPLWDRILEFVASLVENTLKIFSEVIMPLVKKVADYLYPQIVFVVNLIQNIVAVAAGVITDIINSIIQVLEGVIDFLTGVFTLNWEQAFEGLKKITYGFLNGFIGLAEGAVNLIISLVNGLVKAVCAGINAVIDALNSLLSFDIPDWVPIWGGKSWSINLANVTAPQIPKLTIPRLATGTVIPPNKEFLAVLGDQKQGTNIEAPLETIKQAFREALAENGGSSRQMTVVLQVGRRELGRTIVELGREEEQRVGMRIRT